MSIINRVAIHKVPRTNYVFLWYSKYSKLARSEFKKTWI